MTYWKPTFEELEQFDVAETAVGQDRRRRAFGQQRLQPRQAQVLEIVALVLQFVLVDGQPEERRRSAVTADEMQGQRRLIVGIEVGPVHRHDDLAPGAHDLADPRAEQVPRDHAHVAQEPVDLLDRRLRHQSPSVGEPLADQRNRQSRSRHHPDRSVGQRQDALGVQVVGKHPDNKFMNKIKSPLRPAHRSSQPAQSPAANRGISNSGFSESPKNEIPWGGG
jgi:hypothetical protein